MIGKTFFQGVVIVLLASLLASSVPEGGVTTLWDQLGGGFAAEGSDNRGSLDPNG